MHNAGLKFTKLLRIHITDKDPGTVHTRNPNLINERGSKQAGRLGHTCSLSECDWILQDVPKTLESSIHSFLIKVSLVSVAYLSLFRMVGTKKERREEEEGMRKKEKDTRAKSMRTVPTLQCLKVQSRFIRQKVAFSKCLPVQSQILHSSFSLLLLQQK